MRTYGPIQPADPNTYENRMRATRWARFRTHRLPGDILVAERMFYAWSRAKYGSHSDSVVRPNRFRRRLRARISKEMIV